MAAAVFYLFAVSCCFKVLLFPAYRSTDFDVHRHWKAVTRHLPVEQWYFDADPDGGGVRTVHTTDYPPGFLFFESFWSKNFITQQLIDAGWLDEKCLALLDDDENEPSKACVAFLRSSVIISDLVFWLGSWMATTALVTMKGTKQQPQQQRQFWAAFLALVFNPGMLWLDHVHFQYNSLVLGILFVSLSFLLLGNNSNSSSQNFHSYHLAAAASFATLLTLKHLYLVQALWYFCYLLRRYCFVEETRKSKNDNNGSNSKKPKEVFCFRNFVVVAAVTATTFVQPFLPFLLAHNPVEQLVRIFRRLFPFGRGLVHDYWAGNIWALFMGLNKVLTITLAKSNGTVLSEPQPFHVSLILLLSLLPGALYAWKAAAERSNDMLLESFAYTSFAAFLTAYHVHEKAIMTTVLVLTVWFMTTTRPTVQRRGKGFGNDTDNNDDIQVLQGRKVLIFLQVTVWGLLGLFPLLFQPREMLLKLISYVGYLAALLWWCSSCFTNDNSRIGESYTDNGDTVTRDAAANTTSKRGDSFLQKILKRVFEIISSAQMPFFLASAIILVLEFVPIKFFGRFEFVPLALTSVICATCLTLSFLQLSADMIVGKGAKRMPRRLA